MKWLPYSVRPRALAVPSLVFAWRNGFGLRHLPFVFMLFLGQGLVHAQVVEPLTTVTEILRLDGIDAGAHPRKVKIKAVVTALSAYRVNFNIHDGTAGVGVTIGRGQPFPEFGAAVEIEGETMSFTALDFTYPHVLATKLSITGRGVLPPAEPLSMETLNSGVRYGQWGSIEGFVMQWKYLAPYFSLSIVNGSGWTNVSVRVEGPAELRTKLYGARVRVTGAIARAQPGGNTLVIPSLAQVEVLKAGTDDIFEAPGASIADIEKRKVEPGSRVKVKGTVLALCNGWLYLRSEDGATSNHLLSPWLRREGPKVLYGDAGKVPKLLPGDQLELVGSVVESLRDNDSLPFGLSYCQARIVGKAPAPEPVETTLADLAQGDHSGDLVQIRARLLRMDEVAITGGSWRTSLIVESAGETIPVVWHGRAAFAGLKVDDDLAVKALVNKPNRSGPRQLVLISPTDVRSLGISSSVIAQRFWFWGGTGGVIALMLGIWVTSLRRTLKRQRAADTALQAMNTTLEQRVVERTAALEQAQGELHAALDQERELGRLKSRFVTTVSHEFRTPLGVILSGTELLETYGQQLTPERRHELFMEIKDNTHHMTEMIESVLMLGRIESNRLACSPQPINVRTLCEEIARKVTAATAGRGEIVVKAPDADANLDASILGSVLGNLLSNSVKYSSPGKHVTLEALLEKERLTFIVTDEGIGIPEQDLEHVCEPFHRCSNVGEAPGTGLGLAIVQRCAELHGGTLSIASTVGSGTTATVTIPIV